VIPQLR